jgi:hypothetical protein
VALVDTDVLGERLLAYLFDRLLPLPGVEGDVPKLLKASRPLASNDSVNERQVLESCFKLSNGGNVGGYPKKLD